MNSYIVAVAYILFAVSPVMAQEGPDPNVLNQDQQALIAAVRHVEMDMADLYRQIDVLRKENVTLKGAKPPVKAP